MITLEGAQAIAESHLATLAERSRIDLAINASATREEPCCWVFFYNSAVYLQTGSFSHALTGNGPIVVDKESGTVHELKSGAPIDDQLVAIRSNRR